ncbi:MAG: zinc ribbon domain-containing protein [Myxococcota bacterium]|nr:zinc ribbon domain-containing protein [Myxococcota bacterium]
MSALAPCVRCHSSLELGDLRCAVCGLAAPVATLAAPTRAQTTAVRCGDCGAGMRYSVEVAAPRCAFCGSQTQLETQADPVEEPEGQVAFRVTPFQAREQLKHFLGRRSFFRPSDLATAATLETLRPLYWPAWWCSARATVSWAADSDAGNGRSSWAPHAGRTEFDFREVLIPGSRGLTLAECRALATRFNLAKGGLQPVGEAPEGTVFERFEATRSAARKLVVDALEEDARQRLQQGVIPGGRFRKVKVALLLQGLRSRRILLPTYVLAYRYRDKLYRVLIHGEDVEHVIGKAPRSGWKVFLVTLLSVAGAAAAAILLRMLIR